MAEQYSTFEAIQSRLPLESRNAEEIKERIFSFCEQHQVCNTWEAVTKGVANQTDLLFLVFKPIISAR